MLKPTCPASHSTHSQRAQERPRSKPAPPTIASTEEICQYTKSRTACPVTPALFASETKRHVCETSVVHPTPTNSQPISEMDKGRLLIRLPVKCTNTDRLPTTVDRCPGQDRRTQNPARSVI